jgi:DNA repair protein RadC
MSASPEELMKVKGIKETTAAAIKTIPAACERMLKQEIINTPALTSFDKIKDYCFLKLAHKHNERFHILFLNLKYHLIATEEHQHGTINHTPVYPREILSRALALNASAVILVHNHPSGDPKPSEADIKLTDELRKILKMSDIIIYDHIIIGVQGIYSFRQNGLM